MRDAPTVLPSFSVGSTVKVNGKTYVVSRKGEHSHTLKGPRNASYTLNQNVNHKHWFVVTTGRSHPGVEWVETFSVVGSGGKKRHAKSKQPSVAKQVAELKKLLK